MAVDIFLKLSNGIKGEAADETHTGEIDILNWSWGLTQSGTTHVGQGGGQGKVNVQDISVVKYLDLATNDLIKRCSNGEHIEEGTLIVRKAGTNPLEYLTIKMNHILISSYQTGGGADGLDRVQEQMSMNFRAFYVTYTLQMPDGSAGASSSYGWNIAKNIEWDGAAPTA